MDLGDVAFISIVQQARLIEQREISPVDLVNVYLERIERWDHTLCSYITVCAELALEQARIAEKEIVSGRYRGKLHGIPYGAKDQFCTRGIRTTLGSRILSDYVPDHDAAVITRLCNAGAILLGKQNLHEFGKGVTKVFVFGQPRNPWNLEHSPSSSSSGSGVATAAGLCSASLGEDTGGSIRGPAEANGIIGIRPTFGRVSRSGGVMYGWNSDTIGPLARSVEDCALMLGAIAGPDENDSLTSDRPVPDYTKNLVVDLRGLRLAIVRELTWNEEIHPEVLAAIEQAVTVLKSLGAAVEEVSLPLAKYAGPFQNLTSDTDVAAVFLRKWLRTRWHDFDIGTRTRLAASCLVPAVVYDRAMRGRALVRRQVLDALINYDALLSPTNLHPPPRLDDTRDRIEPGADMLRRDLFRRMTNYPFTVANTPTIAVPAGFTKSGLPLSLQIAAKPFSEETVFRIAYAYEQATPWHTLHPDVAQSIAQFQAKQLATVH